MNARDPFHGDSVIKTNRRLLGLELLLESLEGLS